MAEYNISDIRGNGDPQRAYEFEARITGGSDLTLNAEKTDLLVQRVKSVSIPEVSVETIEINYRSSKTLFSGRDASPHTITVSFYEAEGEGTRKFFIDWMANIRNPFDGSGTVGRTNYSTGLVIAKYDVSGSNVENINLSPVFPSSVGEMQLDYETNGPANFDVTFTYDEETVDQGGVLSGIDGVGDAAEAISNFLS